MQAIRELKTYSNSAILRIACALLTLAAFSQVSLGADLNSNADGGSKEAYIVVGVAGFKTFKSDKHDITSTKLDHDAEPSGVWDNLPVADSKVKQSYYLSHFQDEGDLDRILSRFDDRGKCDSKLGLVIMANSWGSNGANALAFKYFKKCGRLADFFVMVDGVRKPLGAYDYPVWAARCVNYFQNKDAVHGGKIVNCKNVDLGTSMKQDAPMFNNHIKAEWKGTINGAQDIKRFMNDPCPRMIEANLEDVFNFERKMEMVVDQLYNHQDPSYNSN